MVLKILFFIWGSVMGSFLNVCIYRMPRAQSVVMPRSHCVHCNKTIAWHENIPLVSFIALRARCSSCKKPIAARYFVVELLTAVLFATLYSLYGLTPALFIYLAFVCGLIVASFIDLEHQLIPDSISLGGLALGLAASVVYPQFFNLGSRTQALLYSACGALAGGVSIYLTGRIGKILFKKDAMGFGDVKFLAMIGSLLGCKKVMLIFLLAPFLGMPFGLVLKIKYKLETIPYGPYLSLAALIVMLWGDVILRRLFYI